MGSFNKLFWSSISVLYICLAGVFFTSRADSKRFYNQLAIELDENKDGITSAQEWQRLYPLIGERYDANDPRTPRDMSRSELRRALINLTAYDGDIDVNELEMPDFDKDGLPDIVVKENGRRTPYFGMREEISDREGEIKFVPKRIRETMWNPIWEERSERYKSIERK